MAGSNQRETPLLNQKNSDDVDGRPPSGLQPQLELCTLAKIIYTLL